MKPLIILRKILKWCGKLVACGVIGLVFYWTVDVALWIFSPHQKQSSEQWEGVGSISVGNNFSVNLLIRPTHPFLAEYDQKLEVFEHTVSNMKRLGVVSLFPNTGGETRVLLYSLTIDGEHCVLLKDRFVTQLIHLKTLDIISDAPISSETKPTFLGTFSGKSYSLRFIPSEIQTEEEALKKLHFCNS